MSLFGKLSLSLKRPYYRVKDFADGRVALKTLLDNIPVGDGTAALSYTCYAGLANRMRAHLVAAALAKRCGRKLVVRWPKNEHCGTTFEELFEYGETDGRRASRHVVLGPESGDCVDGAVLEIERCPDRFVVLNHKWQYVSSDVVRQCLAELQIDDVLRPHEGILAAVEEELNAWPGPMLGVHLRRADFVQVGRAIPIERYNVAIERALESNPRVVGLFLATDATSEELKSLVTGLPLYQRRYFGRASQEGMVSALVDMFLLSHTSHLVLTPQSTYGELAALLGGAPYTFS